jgi:predicted RNA binding protein YcfA (HicA-like mRNA interferase family)
VPKLPCLSGKQLVAALKRLGYEEDHRTGSHIILWHRDPPHRRRTTPDHKEIAKGTLRAILCQAGMSVEELLQLLE